MSPALINLRTPITTSSSSSSSSSSVEPLGSPSQSSLLQNPNPNPQILSSNPFFDLSAISSNTFASTKQHLPQEKIMNSVHGEIGSGAARVPRSTSGRSMPRLVKVRRHGCSSQKGRSSTSSSSATTVSSSDFNPFRPVSESLDRVDEDGVGGGMQELRDRCESWKRFSSSSTLHSAEPFNGLKTSATAVSRNFEFGKSNGGGFVFVANSSSLSSNSGGEKGDASASMLQEEMREKLNIGSTMEFQGRKNGASSLGERASSSLNEGNEKVAFVFKSNSEANLSFGASTSAKLVDELRNLNIENPRNCDNTENVNLSSKANVKNAFVFKGHNNVDSSEDKTVDSKLHDEMKNLNIGEPGNSDGLEKSEDTNFKVNQKDSFSTFVFGRRENYADLPRGSSVATLPDEMNKLNRRSSENSDGVKNTEDMNVKPNEKSSFILGSEKYNAGEFARNDVNKLHTKMDKLHIRSNPGDSWSEISGRVEKTEEAGIKVNVGKAFTFGSDKNHTGFFVGSNGNKLHSKMEELRIGSKIGDSGGFPDTTSSSSRNFLKEKRAVGNSNDNVFSDPTSSSNFQASTSGGNLSKSQEHIVQQNEDLKPSGAFVSPAAGPTFQSVQETFEVPSVESAGNEANSLPTNTSNPFFTHYPDFRTPKHDPSCSRVSGFAGSSQMSRFSAKKGHTNKKSKNRKGKLRQPASVHHWAGQDYASKENSSLGNPESPGHYSPMDFSPYEENIAADQSSRETSVASEDVFNIDGNCILKDTYPSVPVDGLDEDRASATQSLDVKEDDFKSGELNEKGFGDHFERDVSSTCSMEESFSGAEYGCFMSNTEEVANDNDAGVSASEIEIGFDPSTERQESDSRTQFCFASTSEDVSDTNFTFAASGSSQGLFSAAKRNYRRKNKTKQCYDSYSSLNVKKQFDSSCIQFFPPASTSLHFGGVETQKGDPSACHSIRKTISEAEKNAEVKKQSISQSTEIAASQEACEKWRLRGNQAYADGNLFKAEEYYTRGVNCVSPTEIAKSCPRALMLCYSNRAVVRMASGRMREALEDCRKAVGIDAEFLKVQFRAANCHLALGEVEDAIKYFKKILPSGDGICLDRKTVIEASTGLQKAQQVADYLDCCAELLCQKTSKDAENALQIIAEALLLSPYSEKLFQMKAEALLVLRKYSELIQLCEKSLDSAEKNSASQSDEGWKINGSESINISFAKLWRWCMISKSYFYLGKLEEALDFLEKLEQAVSVVQKYGSNALESSIALAVTVRELLRHKTAGNEAFQSGRHLEAVEHYTSALSCSIESRPFAAICFCNRAAAHQALGQITDAIADCSLAIALDGNYPKAISRRATLHEMIRDYGQAVSDLQKLIALLEKQTEEKVNPSGTLSRSTSSASDLKQARTRLSTLEEEARKGIPLNLYLILGVEPSGTASDIKKAYRKAALRHHPDKAGQFLARSENGDDGLWKDIAEEVHKDADRLFKMIGEAYAVLSDPAKRSRYDLEEESRNVLKKGNGCCSSGTPSEGHNFPFERSNSRHHWQDVRRSYRSHSQWSEPSRSYRYY